MSCLSKSAKKRDYRSLFLSNPKNHQLDNNLKNLTKALADRRSNESYVAFRGNGSGPDLARLLHSTVFASPPEHHEIIAGLKIPGPVTEYLNQVHYFWKDYTEAHEKMYSRAEELKKKRQWIENLLRVHHHNEEARAGRHSYFLRANHLSDLNIREYMRRMVRLTQSEREMADRIPRTAPKRKREDIPEEWNWVEQGFVTPARDQGSCGSCYAFSIAGSAEGQNFRRTKTLQNLSVQQLVDCSVFTGNWGCRGGSLRNALRYLLRAGGLAREEDYPYRAKRRLCHFLPWKRRVNVTSYVILPENDEEALEYAVATTGPVACSLDASPYTFQLYHKGIYDDESCSSTRVNHAMLIVGYTKDAWILKNWWGPHWGVDGYMFLRKGKNRCAVARYAGYPVVDDVPLSYDLWR
ncbi:UNVERIFIED_CONTAM: hypothetical protein PYX00_001188 [Menopon gallinae]|uniref:Uncharacterized protein n=1 Tax=Menopon gallinae TaxID=328185 RepID=A0AAW2IBE6_9NEOP